MKLARLSSTIRRWSRNLHRELSFFFAGIVLIYAVSGFLLNHKGDFNAEYDIVNREFRIDDFPAARSEIDKKYVRSILEPLGEAANYTKHYFPEESRMKVFLKGGSSLTVDTESGVAVYESVRKRPLWSALNRLHYNPSLVDPFFGYFCLLADCNHPDRSYYAQGPQRIMGQRRRRNACRNFGSSSVSNAYVDGFS